MCFPNYKKARLGLLVCILYQISSFTPMEDYFFPQLINGLMWVAYVPVRLYSLFKCWVSWLGCSETVLPCVTLALLLTGNRSLRLTLTNVYQTSLFIL